MASFFLMAKILNELNVFGWSTELEDLVLAGLIVRSRVLLLGERGTGKTYLIRQLARALDIAGVKENGQFRSVKIDGYGSQVEHLIGYQLPPSAETIEANKRAGEPTFMQWVYNKDSVVVCDFILIDEATRIPQSMQPHYLNLLDDTPEIEGEKIGAMYRWGSANPLTYAATEPMDEALADRWTMIIYTPALGDMSPADRKRIIYSNLRGFANQSIDEDAAKNLARVIREGQQMLKGVDREYGEVIADFCDAFVRDLNAALGDSNVSNSADFYSPVEGRRASYLYTNICALYAVALTSGRDDIYQAAKTGIKHTFVYELMGSTSLNATTMLDTILEANKYILDSPTERMRRWIEETNDAVSRVYRAIARKAPHDMVGRYVQDVVSISDDAERVLCCLKVYEGMCPTPDLYPQTAIDAVASVIARFAEVSTDSKINVLIDRGVSEILIESFDADPVPLAIAAAYPGEAVLKEDILSRIKGKVTSLNEVMVKWE